jgi:arginyl-tRNA synthetase
MEELSKSLKSFGISDVPKQPGTHPELNPVDIYRSHITELLAQQIDLDPKLIYGSLQYTQSLEKGDLVLPVPALRIKGKKPDALAQELASKV